MELLHGDSSILGAAVPDGLDKMDPKSSSRGLSPHFFDALVSVVGQHLQKDHLVHELSMSLLGQLPHHGGQRREPELQQETKGNRPETEVAVACLLNSLINYFAVDDYFRKELSAVKSPSPVLQADEDRAFIGRATRLITLRLNGT